MLMICTSIDCLHVYASPANPYGQDIWLRLFITALIFSRVKIEFCLNLSNLSSLDVDVRIRPQSHISTFGLIPSRFMSFIYCEVFVMLRTLEVDKSS